MVDPHVKAIRPVIPSAEGCEDCLRIGSPWLHLRLCLTCGRDSSPNRHARKHFQTIGHPIIQSFEPGEDWRWCYEDIGRIAQILDRLAERAARELRKAGIDATLTQADIGLRLRVDDAKAHLKVIEAKRDLVRARIAILRNDLVEADARVESALRYLEEAQSLAVGHQESLAALQRQAQQMLVAIRTKADTMRASIDALLERSNRLLNEMSGHGAAAKTAA